MSHPPHQFQFSFRFEARDHQHVDAWLQVGDGRELGPIHLSEAQSWNMGRLMEEAVIAIVKAADPANDVMDADEAPYSEELGTSVIRRVPDSVADETFLRDLSRAR